MSFCLPVEDVIETNRKMIGAQHVLLDRGKLEGALGRPMHTFDGQLLIPAFMARAATLLDGLVSAHAFGDGNKRTAWISSMIYLGAFGATISNAAQAEAADFVEAVALHQYDVAGITTWFGDRLI